MYIPQSIENIISEAIEEAKLDEDSATHLAHHITAALGNWSTEDLLEAGSTLDIVVGRSSYMFDNDNVYDLEGLILTAVGYKVWFIAYQRIKDRKPS